MHNISFTELTPDGFLEFHKDFNGEGNWWGTCCQCGGKCEQHAIGSLMPGEKEFIAGWLKIPLAEFENTYLDKIVTPLGDIDVLKMSTRCGFLDSNFRCGIKPVKVVLCDVYPIAFDVVRSRVDFFLDPECPLSEVPAAIEYFNNVGIPALKKLNAPVEWYRAVALYDRFSYDYEKIQGKRQNVNKYEPFTLEQILAARI